VFQAVSDPTRRAILDRLRSGRAPVAEIAAGFRMSRPAVSKHLRVLRRARLVREQRSGRQRIYELEAAPLAGVMQWIEAYRDFWQKALMSFKRQVEGEDS
jgi:DNA-binding transcriptional ArsR family regulator